MPRGKRAPVAAHGFQFPVHMQITEREAAICARLVRTLREPRYWLGAFIEWMLERDAAAHTGDGITPEAAEKMLHDIKNMNTWAKWMKDEAGERGAIKRYIGHRFFPDRLDKMAEDAFNPAEEEDFHQLVQMWRKEHPKPITRRPAPAGYLGCGDEFEFDDDD